METKVKPKFSTEVITLNGIKYVEEDYHNYQMSIKPKVVKEQIVKKEIIHKQDNKIKAKIDELHRLKQQYIPNPYCYDFGLIVFDEKIKLLESLL